jgi:hypothetical protein
MAQTQETVEVASERIARLIEEEQRAKPKATKAGDLVPTIDAITCEWLTDVLCGEVQGTEVVDFEIALVSAGTHARHRLKVTYSQTADTANLPTSLFTKTLPTVENRMMVGITGHARTEGGFYTQLRPELDLEIPLCYHSTVDRNSCAAVHILEDLVATKGATFTNYETYVTREMAEDMIDLLAGLHGHFYDDPRFGDEFKWVARFTRWFMGGVTKLHVDESTERALTQAADHIPERLLARREEIWPATMAALKVHEEQPETFLHSDVHIGNWYQTDKGRMGLCDWQCAGRGHWSRDLSYAISGALTIEDRRAWEVELVRRYLARFEEVSGQSFDFDEAWILYRQQMFHALLNWTPTLCPSEYLPAAMQTEEMSLAMIERMTAAIDDLDSLDSF